MVTLADVDLLGLSFAAAAGAVRRGFSGFGSALVLSPSLSAPYGPGVGPIRAQQTPGPQLRQRHSEAISRAARSARSHRRAFQGRYARAASCSIARPCLEDTPTASSLRHTAAAGKL